MTDQYSKIPNTVLEILPTLNLSGLQFSLVMIVARKTYGFHKKSDKISLSQFCKITGANRSSVCKALEVVSKSRLVSKKRLGTLATEYSINENIEEWRVVSKSRLVSKKRQSPKVDLASRFLDNQLVSKRRHTKETITKENIKETIKVKAFEEFYQLYPRKVGKANALKAFTKIRPEELEAVMTGLTAQLPKLLATEPQFRPHPATWLNARRWEDELEKDAPKTDEHYAKEYEQVGYSRFKTLYGKDLADKFFQLTMKI